MKLAVHAANLTWPGGAGELAPTLAGAGVRTTDGLGDDGLAEVVAAAAARASAGNAQQVVLPTEQLVAGSATG